MSVKVHYKGRIGNHLFQYVFARLFAEKNNLYLKSPFSYQTLLKTTPHRIGGSYTAPAHLLREPLYPMEEISQAAGSPVYRQLREAFLSGYGLHGALEEPRPPGQYLLDGYFENSDFYNPNEARIKSFFALDKVRKNTRDIVVNVRLEDFARIGIVLDADWYLDILERETFDKVYIVGARPDEPYLKHFARYKPVIVPTDPVNDFHFLRRFDKIVCSNSTYCWWAAFLSEASRIYTSDKWISPLLRSCKHSIQTGAGYENAYRSVAGYVNTEHLVGFRERITQTLNTYIVPNDEKMKRLVTDCVRATAGALEAGTREEAAPAGVLAFNINQVGNYAVRAGNQDDEHFPPDAAPACTLYFPNGITLVNSLCDAGYFAGEIEKKNIAVSGPLDFFMSKLDVSKLEVAIAKVMEDFTQKVNFPAYVQEEDLAGRVAGLLAHGSVLGWFYEEGAGNDRQNKLSFLFRPDPRLDAGRVFTGTAGLPLGLEVHMLAEDIPGCARCAKCSKTEPIACKRRLTSAVVPVGNTDRLFPVLKKLKQLTGVSALTTAVLPLGDATHMSCEKVLDYFYTSNADYLVVDQFIVSRSSQCKAG